MSSNGIPPSVAMAVREPIRPPEAPLTRWRTLRLVLKMVELRLRFVMLLSVTGLVFAYWDTIWNRYDKWTRPTAELHSAAPGLEFYCPMHPHVVQDGPGTCPVCGMALARRQKGEKPVLPAGVTARIVLAPYRVEQAGIKTDEVTYASLTQAVTTVGYVAFDERRVATIISKVRGKSRVEKLHVNVTGQHVKVGEPLAELYSPELSQAIQELLSASRRAMPSGKPESEVARSLTNDRQEMVRASAEKLEGWGITHAQIDLILTKGKTDFTFPILSPKSGNVFRKYVVDGQEVMEGSPMFEVVDLDTVWVQAQIYEHQLGLVHEGQAAQATVDAFRGESFSGRLDFMQTHVDPATRSVEVRFSLENAGHRLRPGMFATVTVSAPVAAMPEFRDRMTGPESPARAVPLRRAALTVAEQKNCPVTLANLGSMGDPIAVQVEGREVWTCCAACLPKLKAQPAKYLVRLEPAPSGRVLSVPESAVIDTGTRKVVYVECEPGVYEGREVVLGPRAGDRFPLLKGLAPGEKVAAAGAFLIDAESRLNPGITQDNSNDAPAHSKQVSTQATSDTLTSAPKRH